MNRLETLIAIWMKPFQRLENAAIQLLTLRFVNTATGVQLDVLGRIVGQPRGGLVDDVYRRYIRARIATNRATGRREELIRIARLIVDDPTAKIFAQKQANATVFMRIDAIACAASTEIALASFLRDAGAAGCRVVIQSNAAAPGARFKFSGGGTSAGPGFGSSVHPGSGGLWADMQD